LSQRVKCQITPYRSSFRDEKSTADVDFTANVQLSIPIKSFAADNIRYGNSVGEQTPTSASPLVGVPLGTNKSTADVDFTANFQLSIPIKSFAADNIRYGAAPATETSVNSVVKCSC
jgi:hypothetical protein